MQQTATATLDHRLPPGGTFAPRAMAHAAEPRVAPRALDPEPYRASLMRFALCMLRNTGDAEDVVQETLLVALRSPQTFAGRSSVKTWLHGILRHKITDTFRRQAREVPLDDDSDADSINEPDALFTQDGHWREPPSAWRNPEAALSQRHFFEVLEGCIASLPKNTARVFTMREVMGLEPDEICAALGISRSNCSVMLHRARMKLRILLEQRWFGAQVSTSSI